MPEERSGAVGRLQVEGALHSGRTKPLAAPDLSLAGEHQIMGDPPANQHGSFTPLADAGAPPEDELASAWR